MRLNRFWQPNPRAFGKRPTERVQRHGAPPHAGATGEREAHREPSPAASGDRPHDDPRAAPVPAETRASWSPDQRGGDSRQDEGGSGRDHVPSPARPAASVWPPVDDDPDDDLGAAEPSRSPEPAPDPTPRMTAPIPAALRHEPWAAADDWDAPTADVEGAPSAPSWPPGEAAYQSDRPAQPPDPAPKAEAPRGIEAEELQPPADEFDDVAVTIGRVVSIRGSVIWGALYDDADGATARAARMGALVTMRGPESRVFGVVNALERDVQAPGKEAERTLFEIQVLGEISNAMPDAGFQRGVSSYPPLDAPVTTVTIRDLAKVYARPRTSSVHVGRLRHNPKVPAFVLTDSLLGKHFAVLGTTGAGKSCAVTVILRSILDEHPNGHIVLIDPHNEYAGAFADRAELLNPSNLRLPYWLLNFQEIAHILIGGGDAPSFAQLAILKDAILKAKVAYAGDGEATSTLTVDTPVPYRLSDLSAALKEGMGMLHKSEPSGPYLSLIARIESLRADHRYAFMFDSIMVRDTMKQILAQLLRIPVEGKPITIIDISGVPSEIVDVVVSVLFRLTFELAVWSERGATPPVLLVCEEAHRYVPAADDAVFAPTKQVISRIAKEGRKYGVTLCLVSQRPSELAISSLAQCNTMFALRMSNEHDQRFVAQALSENARWLVDGLPSLNTQEAVVVGDGVTVPVHVRFKDLAPEHRPSSRDPSFSVSWQSDIAPDFLDRSIDRWRKQIR